MKKNFFKKALSVFTAMAMALSLMTGIPFSELGLGITVSAEETTPDFSAAKVLTAVDGALCIDGEALAINGSESTMPAGNYKLTGDITTDIYVLIRDNSTINLDLNGYTWNMSEGTLNLYSNAALSLYDTSVDGDGKITSSFVRTIWLRRAGATFNLFSGMVENTSDEANVKGVFASNGIINLYGGTIKSNAYAVDYYLNDDITINIDDTVLECGNGHAQISTSLTSNEEPCAVIDVSDYEGGTLTVDAVINKAGEIKIFTGIQSAQDAENYKVNVSCDDNENFFMEKEEYNEETKEKYITVSAPSFTTQPTEENDYTVAFNHPDATLQWCEVTVYDSATYSEEDGDLYELYEVNAGDTLIASISECSDDFSLIFYCSYNDEDVSALLDSSRKTASVTFDSACSVHVNFGPSPLGTGEYKIEHVRYTELEGENGVQLSKTECETTYVCKATVGETVYYSDEVTIEQEHSYTCTATSDNVITKECANCGKSGTLTITAEGGVYDGTTAYGATVIKTGIFENEGVTVDYYQGDTLIGTDAPVNAGTYTAKITYEEVTASVTYTINATPTADMFTYIESAVYDGTAKSANVVVKDGITGVGEIANIKYYQNDVEVTPINAGTYTVKIDVAKGDLFDAATDIEVGTFTINKATPPALTIPTATSITYGEKLSASTLSDGWAWVDGTIVPDSYTDCNAYIEVDDSNYDYTSVYGYDSANHRVVRDITVIINRATLTITANSYTIKVGSALPTYDYTVTGLVGDDTLPVDVTISCSATDSNAVGAYPITISGVVSDAPLASHYVINYVNGTLTITEKDIQEIEADDVTLTYGETKNIGATTNGDGAITYSTTSDVISIAADGTITALKAGTATVTINAAETDNYAAATKTVTVTVNKKKVAVPTADTTEYTYTGTAQTYSVTSTDDYTVEGGVQTNAGEYPITITLNNENYEWDGTLGTYKFVINKAAVTLTAKSYTIKVGEALPTYAYDVAGLVNGETLPIDVTISCNAAASNTAGTYTITVSGAANSTNYTFAYVNGTLTISNKLEQTITASDVTLTYGETGKKITATSNGDGAITYSTTSDVISVAADGTITAHKAGTVTVTIKAAETADYAEATKTISVTVNKKKVAVPTADTTEYTYTGTAQTYGVTSTDDYTVEGGVQTNAGEYPITITLNNENYEWDGTLGTYKFVINKAAVTVTAKSYTIKVGDTLPTYAYDVAGLVNDETLPIDVTISCNAADSNTAGTYTITVSGAANSTNYTFAYVNGTLTISNKLEQTITASDVTLTYGETGKKITATSNGDGAITYSTTSDVISVATDGTITALKVGTATVTINVAETDTYAAATKTVTVTVNKAAVTVTADDKTIYIGGTPEFTYTIKGLVNGEELKPTVTLDCDYDANKIGTYTITVTLGSTEDDCYTYTAVNGTLTVKRKSSGGGGGGGGGGYRPSTPTNPEIGGKSASWVTIASDISKLPIGSETTIELNGNYDIPVDVIKAIADRDVKITFVVDSTRSWYVDGAEIETPAAADLSILYIASLKVDGLRGDVGTKIRIDGTNIPTELVVALDKKHAGKFANLYKKKENELVFVDNIKVDENGKVILPASEQGDYVIMLCEFSDRKGDVSNDGVTNALDASAILKDIVELEESANPVMLDYNGDGRVNALDASSILIDIVNDRI